MPKHLRRRYLPPDVLALEQRLRAEKAEEMRQLVLIKADKELVLKNILDHHDDYNDLMFYDLVLMASFQDVHISLYVATSGTQPINTQTKMPVGCVSLDELITLIISRQLSGNGSDFRGPIKFIVEDNEVTVEELQQLVIAYYEQNGMDCFQHYPDHMLLKVGIVFVFSDEEVLHNILYCQVALNCYYDLRGWRVFSWDKFPGEKWYICKSRVDTTLPRSEDGCYHVNSIDDLILRSNPK